ncbi:17911_t:CDS:2 [Funneliformis caledonium]|uniref:17911_t:CDS:1 n=1 Tax=Funneliformis caledonium TaxID=1117310 RepID=A0A9N9G9F8_9GLOM|nr:17911_t:CDS:2 [Funneliformis caledonium]
MSIFDLKTDFLIKEFMQGEGRNIRNPYLELSHRIPKFTAEQISHRWNYKLHPRITNGPFTKEEKRCIYQWVKRNSKTSEKIKWSNCQKLLEKKFHKVRAINRIQGVWTTYQRLLKNRVKKPEIPGTSIIDFGPPQDDQQSGITTNIVLPNISHLIPVGTTTTTIVSPRPLLPTLIPNANFQPAMNISKMMPLF